MRIAIIGGGPGGLITAYLLQQRADQPLDITLFEASRRLGGKIFTNTFDAAPLVYEAGAAELYDYSMTGPDPLRELVRDLGLATRPMTGRTVILDGQALRTRDDVRRHLGQKTVDALEDFRHRATQFISPPAYYESDWKQDNQDPLSRQCFDDLLSTVPDEAARRYIRVAVHSDLATEPHLTSALYGLQNYLMNEPGYLELYTIDGGIESLVRALAARIQSRVLLDHRVTKVTRVTRGPEAVYRVESRGHYEYLREEFDIVVAALPNSWIPAIQWGGESLSEAMRAHHAHYDYPAHYLRVSLLFEEPFWRDRRAESYFVAESYFMMDAFGGCCVYDETSRGGCAPFGVLGWLLAGEAALNLSNLPDSVLIEEMLNSLPPWLQRGRGLLCEGRVHRWVGSVNGRPAGHPAREPDSRHVPDPDGNPRLLMVGDYLFDSTLNGVMDSAEVVAERILDEMRTDLEEPIVAQSSRQG
jgi:monoamine oxidase